MTLDLDKLDRLCAEKVMGWTLRNYSWCEWRDNPPLYKPGWYVVHERLDWQPTRHIAQAWDVLEKFEIFQIYSLKKKIGIAFIDNSAAYEVNILDTKDVASGYAETAPLAIVKACLRARGVEVE